LGVGDWEFAGEGTQDPLEVPELPEPPVAPDDPVPPDDAVLSVFDAEDDSAAGLAASVVPDDFLA
jgi:hypothetical protein